MITAPGDRLIAGRSQLGALIDSLAGRSRVSESINRAAGRSQLGALIDSLAGRSRVSESINRAAGRNQLAPRTAHPRRKPASHASMQ